MKKTKASEVDDFGEKRRRKLQSSDSVVTQRLIERMSFQALSDLILR